jgi:dTMP kinase
MTILQPARGRFVTFEGGEACGKSTQARLLVDRLQQLGVPAILTREPGGTLGGEAVRGLFFDPAANWQPLAELFLVMAARHQHVRQLIEPALAAGTWVICDRFCDSTLVYQGILGGLDLELIAQQNAIACQGLTPDITFLLDIPQALQAKRLEADASKTTRQDTGLDHAACLRGFRQLAAAHADRIILLDGGQPPADLAVQIEQRIRTLA